MAAALLLMRLLSGACIDIEEDRILARHLREQIPEFQRISADAVIGLAPRPGLRRILPSYELSGFARKHHISIGASHDVCVVRTALTMTPDALHSVLLNSLQRIAGTEGDVSLELLEHTRTPVPAGRMEFLESGISPTDIHGTQLWRGTVVSPGGDRYPVWAKVRLQQKCRTVVPRETIPVGTSISETQLEVVTRQLPFGANKLTFADPGQLTGRVAARELAAERIISRKDVLAKREIQAGDTVAVTATTGGAFLRLEAIAESSGIAGGSVVLKNPISGKRFRATVAGTGRATVQGHLNAN